MIHYRGMKYQTTLITDAARRERMTQRILIPFDGSEPAWTALKDAVEQYSDAEIIVLYALQLNQFDFGTEGTGTDDLPDVSQNYAEELMTEAKRFGSQHGVTLTTTIETGPPDRVIVDYAEKHNIDQIVIGSHGRSGISRILLGSVAEKVARRSSVSVTLVR